MPDFVDGAAEEDVANEPVPVAGYGDEITVFGFRYFQNLRGRIAERKFDARNRPDETAKCAFARWTALAFPTGASHTARPSS